jgi:hypothetical protein
MRRQPDRKGRRTRPWCAERLLFAAGAPATLVRSEIDKFDWKADAMRAIVVYESHWGNTEAIARAIADGFGPEARALTTDEATGAVLADADLIVAGAPLVAFGLTSDKMFESIAAETGRAPSRPDLSHPTMAVWVKRLPRGKGYSAAFETRMRWSPGGASGAIDRGLEGAGYQPLGKGRRFLVKGKYGPLRDGELERARQWGADLAERLQGHRPAVADFGGPG